ncbi:MAG TPA: hypothetical protein VHW96_07150 [Solirubrobacteraceae bacterium]|jgi:hypothetical protein|nr:hypothetical protein [Solirubrobacteraceae bacterium]
MRQLSVCARLLATALLALGARVVISGPTLFTALTATIIAWLLLASLLLIRYGRRHPPRAQSPAPTGRRPVRTHRKSRRVSRRV